MQQINKSENEEGGKKLFYSTVYLLLPHLRCLQTEVDGIMLSSPELSMHQISSTG